MAQQGPPPRRRARPPASAWQDQPAAPGWQDQPSAPPPAWLDQQDQPPVPSWQEPQPQSPPPGPARHGQHADPAQYADPPPYAAPAPYPGPAQHADPAQHGAPALPSWADQSAPAPAGWAEQQAQDPAAGWQDQPAAPPVTDWPAELDQPPVPGWRDEPVQQRAAEYRPDAVSDDDDLPPWAGLSIAPRRPRESSPSRPRRGEDEAAGAAWRDDPAPTGLTRRAIATRARKARRKLVIGGGVAIAVVVLAAGGWLIFGPKTAAPHHGPFVNSFQPGELRTVPDACQAVPASVLGKYLPGKPTRVASAALSGRSESQCTWILDAKPVYRVLEVTSQAFAPSGLNTGNGSATFGAIDSYGSTMQTLLHPVKKTHLPPATVTKVPGLGAAAFSALQVVKSGGNTTDLVTLVVRDRNVLVTIAMQGLDHSSKGHYGPVSVSELQAGAAAAARVVLTGLK